MSLKDSDSNEFPRREFVKAACGTPFATVLLQGVSSAADELKFADGLDTDSRSYDEKTWLFWNWWHVEQQNNAKICQGQPRWHPEVYYTDPTLDEMGCWPRVWYDEEAKRWQMLYCISGFPLSLMGAISDDGFLWRPMVRPDIDPGGDKLASNHLLTVNTANGGPVYHDPVAVDGYPFKLYCIDRSGGKTIAKAKLDSNNYFHEFLNDDSNHRKRFAADPLIYRSHDGVKWELYEDSRWGAAPWYPDPPFNCFYNHLRQEHVMVSRPGWGDRRISMQRSGDALKWSDLKLVLEPDLLDPQGIQFYGMPVIPYYGQFVGLLWIARFNSSSRLNRFNKLSGHMECQLTYSSNGVHFQRGNREPFIGLNDPGQPGSGIIYPTSVVEYQDQIRIYSASMTDLHFQRTTKQFKRKGEGPPSAILLHTLRKDGFAYLTSQGNWATMISKPFSLRGDELLVNIQAPSGEASFQITDLKSNSIPGFAFTDFEVLRDEDVTNKRLRWKNVDISSLRNRPIRIEANWRNARIYAIRGEFHWLDATRVTMLEDGQSIEQTIEPRRHDY